MSYLKALFAIGVLSMVIPVGAAQAERPKTCTHPITAQQNGSWAKKLVRSHRIPKWAKAKHRKSVVCAAGPNYRRVIKRRWRKVRRSILPRNHNLWVRIGRCEQPGSGYKGVYWTHPGPTYQGGLGIWYGNWTSLKPKRFPSNAGQATWRQQMKVANKLAGIYGFSAWGAYSSGCAR